jgi:predicted nuclease of predicted toxin-antitoxin system
LLRSQGHEVVHVAEVGRERDADVELVRWAVRERRVIVTLDADFHAIVAVSGEAWPSVVRVRIEGLKSERAAEIIGLEVARSADALTRGALVTIYPDRTALHMLPVG